MPDGDQKTITSNFLVLCGISGYGLQKRRMSVGDRVRVWNGGQSWPGQIRALPGEGRVVIHGVSKWDGYRATVPRSRLTRSAALEHDYECRLTVVCNPSGAARPASLHPKPFTMSGVTIETPLGIVLPLSPCLDALTWCKAPV